jgi:PIN domain nuclease of toxin-antitoxin system
MLDVDYGAAKDQATKTVRAFEMYKSVRGQSISDMACLSLSLTVTCALLTACIIDGT